MPEPEPDRRRANGTRGISKRDKSRDVEPRIQSYTDDAAIQDRIRQWQAQNVQDAKDLDNLSVRSRPRSEAFVTPDLSRASSPITKEPQTTPRKRSTKWVQQNNKGWIKQRRSVRNSHDRSDRCKHDTPDIQSEMESVRVEHDPSPPIVARTESTHARNVTSSRAEREERRRRRREARTTASGENSVHHGKISKPDGHEPRNNENSDNDFRRDSNAVHPFELEVPNAQCRTTSGDTLQSIGEGPDKMDGNAESNSEDVTYLPSKYAQTLGKGLNVPESIQPPKGRKMAILNRTMGILGGRSDAPPPPSNRIPSIEAWLEEQPGPSFEHDDQTSQPKDDPKPSKKSSRRKTVSIEPTILEVDDPNKIWDSITAARESRSSPDKSATTQQPNTSSVRSETFPSKRRLFSFEAPQSSSKGEEPAPPTPEHGVHELQSSSNLHRRGAKSRRAKSYSISAGVAPAAIPADDSADQQFRISKVSQNLPASEERSDHTSRLTNANKIVDADLDAQTKFDHTQTSALKRKLTHEDLISILSQPRLRKSTKSVRSVQRAQNTHQAPVLPGLFEAMRLDEPKYGQELRTLVDGVTPVLLQSLLSKTDAEATLGLFSNDQCQDTNFTKPIIQMGVVLERLKALHGRIPLKDHEIDGFLSWASSAQKHYQDYIKWYRLGFQGILVNLAPLGTPRTAEEELLARDLDGDVTNADGQKVDVAYLQKRPLVRLKKISKLVSAIRDENPTSEKASRLADAYVDLTEKAKQRYSEEQGRLEDEAAANIDVTRTRDIRTMAPTTSAQVDKHRKVRARDCFEMTLYHSTGQRMDCRVEIIIRDDPQPGGVGGDILICQVEESSKWLLFAPVNLNNVSARRDESTLDIVLMIRGMTGIADSWYQLLALKADVPDAVVEWTQMLGSTPLPPKVPQTSVSLQPQNIDQALREELKVAAPPKVSHTRLSAAALASLPSDIDVPIGEPSVLGHTTQKEKKANTATNQKQSVTIGGTRLNLGGGLQKREIPDLSLRMKTAASSERYNSSSPSTQITSANSMKPDGPSSLSGLSSKHLDPLLNRTDDPRKDTGPLLPHPPLEEPHRLSTTISTSPVPPVPQPTTLRRTQLASPQLSNIVSSHDETRRSKVFQGIGGVITQQSSDVSGRSIPNRKSANADSGPATGVHGSEQTGRLDDHTPTKSKASTSLTESIREQWAAVSGYSAKQRDTSSQNERIDAKIDQVKEHSFVPTQRRQDVGSKQESQPPPPPPHRDTLRRSVYSGLPLSTGVVSDGFENKTNPCSTPELDQEYQSSSSASLTDSDDDDKTSDTSEEDYWSELKDQATPLVDLVQGSRRISQVPSKALPSLPSLESKTLQPSDSASNAPYRKAPSPSAYPAEKKRCTVAMVCSWSDRGVWEPIQDEECSIVISPGLVQAFRMTVGPSQLMARVSWADDVSPPVDGPRPLVEFELTPIVPLRKGTALDITIRSPPTPRSTVRTTNNVMFRSKTTQECEKLYHLINWARCNNPTYAQLARSRAREESLTFNPHAAATKTRSWFSFGSHQKSSYRASSQPPPSMADTGMTSSSSFSAFSALKKFGKNSPFSLKRSSVIRKSGVSVTGESLYSASNGTSSGSGTSTPAPSQAGFVPGLDGPNVPLTSAEAVGGGGMVNNMKIHLFLRQGQKWEQLGQCHLTVLPAVKSSETEKGSVDNTSPSLEAWQAPPPTISTGPSAMPNGRVRHYRLPSSSHTPHKIHGDGREKRILITSVKNKELVLLDETLGETCFEKIMQTGIAINVWKEDEAVQDRGGVLTGRSRTYMVQFKTSMEASWVFNMCGVYRYGAAPGS